MNTTDAALELALRRKGFIEHCPRVSTLYLPDVIVCDQISQAFPLHICIPQVIKDWKWWRLEMRLNGRYTFPCLFEPVWTPSVWLVRLASLVLLHGLAPSKHVVCPQWISRR